MDHLFIPLSDVLAMVGGLCSNCQEKVRQKITQTQINGKPTAAQRLNALLNETAREYDITPDDILTGGQHRTMVEIRRKIAIKAREQGYSYPQIAGLLKMHHTSIMHLVGARDKKLLTTPI